MGFNIVCITFDQYQSVHLRQKLEDIGIDTDLLSCDRTDEVPVTAKMAITENRVTYPYDRRLCNEAKYLKYIKGNKVDHTSRSTKDTWDSYASVIYKIESETEEETYYEIF